MSRRPREPGARKRHWVNNVGSRERHKRTHGIQADHLCFSWVTSPSPRSTGHNRQLPGPCQSWPDHRGHSPPPLRLLSIALSPSSQSRAEREDQARLFKAVSKATPAPHTVRPAIGRTQGESPCEAKRWSPTRALPQSQGRPRGLIYWQENPTQAEQREHLP
ncbi:hypothetical protein NDU88_003063 [Pleurodeles waltl]|uniref:Uncharacterized protein n=1 Tax=Pleurodeles waltl TaxID=8319 RepID=A0AAV7RH66_PLEWA|nr:hypothetical protein NDU88_003063 [Pleurodeles waltl]